jgi:LPXTG-motif cell wall-anchored protein
MQTQMVRLANLGDWRDTWGDLRDKYNDTFNPDVPLVPKPAGTALPAAAAESKVFGIPSTWLLYGGLAAIAGAALFLVSNKKKSKR